MAIIVTHIYLLAIHNVLYILFQNSNENRNNSDQIDEYIPLVGPKYTEIRVLVVLLATPRKILYS